MAEKTPSFYEKVAPILLVVVVALAFAVGVLWQKVSDLSGGTAQPTSNNAANAPQAPTTGKLTADQASKLPKVTSEDHIIGKTDADVIVIEYSDFQCPFCAQFHPTVKQALASYGDKLALVYRHFPLDSIHPQARPAANASECIAELGGSSAFWKFADEVFAAQETKLADLSATAVGLGINKAAFDSCFNAKKHENLVEEDYQGGITAGVTGTPGSYVVNKKGEVWMLPGAVPLSSLNQAIDEALASN
jgi:protein-disulfide isomerase